MPKVNETEHPGYQALRDRATCLTCQSKSSADLKGLCMKCYSSAKKLVDAGKTTWGDLASIGLAIINETPFEKAFRERSRQP